MEHYEKYKDSGVEWLGKIPEGWEVNALKRFAKICNGEDHKKVWDENGDYPIIGSGGVFGKSNKFLYDQPSVILGRKGTIDKPRYIDTPFWTVDTAYYTDIFPKTDKRFFYYLCLTINFELYKYGSAVPSMNQETLSQIPFTSPPKPEQTAIAKYLDRKTAEIDQLIAQKERLLSLYEEEKTAIINQAVTQGINPDVKLKDSGIDWLGEIPEHWEVRKIKHLLRKKRGALKTGPFGSQIKNSDLNPLGKFKVYTQRNVMDSDYIAGEDRIDDKKFRSLKEFEVMPRDILFTTRGTIGKCSIFPENMETGILHPCLIRIQIDERLVLSSWIINYVSNSSFFIENVKLESNSTIIDVIYGGTLKEVIVPLPPVKEQTAIVQHIETETTRINAKISKTKKIIALQKEYRTALISEVVTGKIKVTQEVTS